MSDKPTDMPVRVYDWLKENAPHYLTARPSPPAQEADANEHTMSGSLVFKGTRILISSVASYINRGSSNVEILEAYPDLTNDQVEAVRAFLERVFPSQSSLIKVLTEALEAAHTQLTNLGGDTRKIILVDSSVSHDEIQAAVLDQVESALSMAKEGNHEPK